MDSQVQADGRQQEVVDDEWRKDKLPEDDIAVPFGELPDPEADNGAGGSTGPGCSGGESLREQENKAIFAHFYVVSICEDYRKSTRQLLPIGHNGHSYP